MYTHFCMYICMYVHVFLSQVWSKPAFFFPIFESSSFPPPQVRCKINCKPAKGDPLLSLSTNNDAVVFGHYHRG